MLGYTQIRPCFQSRHLRWTDAFFQGALDYAGIQGFAPVGTKALNLVAGTHLLKVGSSLGWGQGFYFAAKKAPGISQGLFNIGNFASRKNDETSSSS